MADNTTITVPNIGDISAQVETASRLVVNTDMVWVQTAGDADGNPQTVKIPATQFAAYIMKYNSQTKPVIEAYEKIINSENERIANEETRQKQETQRQTTFEDNEKQRQADFESAQSQRQSTFTTDLTSWQTSFTNAQDARQTDYEEKETKRQSDFESNEQKRQDTFNSQETQREDKVNAVIATANDINDHPGYPGADGYWYKYDSTTKAYTKTNVLLKGDSFKVTKVYKSVSEMQADDISQYEENTFMLINTGDTENEDDAKLYVVDLDSSGNKQYDYLCDLSGFRGFTGKTPQISIGSITTVDEDVKASASLSEDGTDSNGNPKFLLNIAVPRGKALKYSDLTSEQIKELQKPATEAAESLQQTVESAQQATDNAQQAADDANAKIKEMDELGKSIADNGVGKPTAMSLVYNKEISIHNSAEQHIEVLLTPSSYPKNAIYQVVEGTSLSVNPSGLLTIKGTGVTKFWIIPTNNTELWQEISINVRGERLRKTSSGNLRLANGKLRIA